MPHNASAPAHKVTHASRTSSSESADGIRKRVCKACDRCRLKKSKCDGSHPCSRCKADNAICVFGERKKSHDKIYPKGYVEMLEQQQSQLVSGLQEMYKRLRTSQQWDGAALAETNGHPLTHDILASLNLLETKHDGSTDIEAFEEDVKKLQARLIADGAGYAHRRGSFSSESDHSQHGHARSASHSTPVLSKPSFDDRFDFSAPPSPHHPNSPAFSHGPTSFQQAHSSSHSSSQLHANSPLSNDPQFYQAEWAYPEVGAVESLIRSRFSLHAQSQLGANMSLGADLDPAWDASHLPYDLSLANLTSYPAHQLMNAFTTAMPQRGLDAIGLEADQMDIDLNQYIKSVT